MDWDLDRDFDPRRVSSISAQDIFTNRLGELEAFEEALPGLRAPQLVPGLQQDLQHRNVLAFYGIGGIGKTTLSCQLEQRFEAGRYADAAELRISCRVDLDNPVLLDLETSLIHLRSAIGRTQPRWPAYDLAFAAYWERQHPGVPFRDYVESSGLVGRWSNTLGLADQLQDTIDALVGGVPFAGFARKATTGIVAAIRNKITRDGLLRSCPFFERILMATSGEAMLPFLPALLSWDLEQLRSGSSVDMVFFFDTWEAVESQRRERGGIEDQLVRLMFLLPNSLFVITGRNRLSWGDRQDSAIRYSGASIWPALAARTVSAGTMQQLVGGLSTDDSISYLQQRLTRDGAPAISQQICRRIVASAEGVPLYLDLSADYFDELSGAGVTPRPEQFGGTFPQLVLRLMRDLYGDERTVLRAAALTGSFDHGVLRAACGGVRDAVIDRFLRRQFVRSEVDGWLPYALSAPLRVAVREHDQQTDDPWSENEWEWAARGVLQHLGERLGNDLGDPVRSDRQRVIQGFGLAFDMAVIGEETPDWLFELAYIHRLLDPKLLLAPSTRAVTPGTAAEAFANTCLGMARRAQGHHEAAITALRAAAAAPNLSHYASLFIDHRLGKALEEGGYFAEAKARLTRAAAITGRMRAVADKDVSRIEMINGDPRRAITWALAHVTASSATRRVQALDLLGWTYWLNGDFGRAEESFRAIYEDPELKDAGISRDTSSRHLALVVCWQRPQDGLRIADEALVINQERGQYQGVAQALAAKAIAGGGFLPRESLLGSIERARALSLRESNETILWWPLIAEFFVEACEHHLDRCQEIRTQITGRIERQGLYPSMDEVVAGWLRVLGDDEAQPRFRGAWLDASRGVQAWIDVLTRRHQALADLQRTRDRDAG